MDISLARSAVSSPLVKVFMSMARDCSELGVPVDFSRSESDSMVNELAEARDILKNRSIAFVDNDIRYLAGYMLPLELATDGNAKFIKVTNQKCGDLADQILQINADCVLVDYYLFLAGQSAFAGQASCLNYTGAELVREIRSRQKNESRLILIGFSADGMFEEFLSAGADGAAVKLDPINREEGFQLQYSPPAISVTNVSYILRDLYAGDIEPAQSLSVTNIQEPRQSLDWFAHNACRGKPLAALKS